MGKHQAEWVARNGRGHIQPLGRGLLSDTALAAGIVVVLPYARGPEVYVIAAQMCGTGSFQYTVVAGVVHPNTPVVVAVGQRRHQSRVVALPNMVDDPLGIAVGAQGKVAVHSVAAAVVGVAALAFPAPHSMLGVGLRVAATDSLGIAAGEKRHHAHLAAAGATMERRL